MFQDFSSPSEAYPIGMGRGPLFEPVEICMFWPWLETAPERVEAVGNGLAWMFQKADRRWNEGETKRRIIHPILTEILNFPLLELTESPIPIARYGKTPLFPDYSWPQACVIEAKRMGVSLLNFCGESSNFSNPLDQGVSYLDSYDARSCIVTNGWDWYAIWRTNDVWDAGNSKYFGARFRLDDVIASGDRIRLGQFLSMFNATCLSGRSNRAVPITGFQSLEIKRDLYQTSSTLYFVNASDRPLKGRGSRFLAPSETDWSM